MKINTTELLSIFDDLSDLTNEEIGSYWFNAFRSDGLIVSLVVSIYENKVNISVSNNQKTAITSLHFNRCSEVNVLDEKKKCLEILHQDKEFGRCFISLLGDLIIQYEE